MSKEKKINGKEIADIKMEVYKQNMSISLLDKNNTK